MSTMLSIQTLGDLDDFYPGLAEIVRAAIAVGLALTSDKANAIDYTDEQLNNALLNFDSMNDLDAEEVDCDEGDIQDELSGGWLPEDLPIDE